MWNRTHRDARYNFWTTRQSKMQGTSQGFWLVWKILKKCQVRLFKLWSAWWWVALTQYKLAFPLTHVQICYQMEDYTDITQYDQPSGQRSRRNTTFLFAVCRDSQIDSNQSFSPFFFFFFFCLFLFCRCFKTDTENQGFKTCTISLKISCWSFFLWYLVVFLEI